MKITWAVKSFNFSIQNLFNLIFNFQMGTTLTASAASWRLRLDAFELGASVAENPLSSGHL